MDRKSCRFLKDVEICSSPTHPLHLYSDKVKWMSAFGRGDSPCIASISHQVNSNHSYENQLFVVVHLNHFPNSSISSDTTADTVEEKIVLLASSAFLWHYGVGANETSLAIAPTRVFPLSRVILSAKSQDSFTWANSLSFERGLMVTGSSHKQLLLRQGDWFLGQPEKIYGDDPKLVLHHFQNLTVLESYPVKQGYIHSNTEVVITLSKQENPYSEDDKTLQNDLAITIAEDQLHSSCIPHDFDSVCEVLCCQELANRLSLKDREIVSTEAFTSGEANVSCAVPADESDSSEGLEQGYFVIDKPPGIVKAPQDLSSKFYTVCRLRVRIAGTHFSSNHQYLHQSMLYAGRSLVFNSTTEVDTFCASNEMTVKITILDEVEVPFAKEVHLALILSPEYSPSSQFDQTLMKYLKTARILKKHDVIAINTANNVEFLSETNLKDANCETLYYKVVRFSEEDENRANTYFRVDLQQTVLFQDGSVNSYIPRLSMLPAAVYGLRTYVEDMRGLISPYLAPTREITSVCTIMMSGPPGCGKKSVVTAVASVLGLHVLTVPCHELMADTSGATEAKITNAVKRASVYAPCILILNGIECLGKDSESSKADHRVCNALQMAVNSLISETYPVIVVALTSVLSSVVPKLRSQLLHKVEMGSLTEQERRDTSARLTEMAECGKDVNTHWIAKHTVGFMFGEFWTLLRISIENAVKRVRDECAIGSRLTWLDEMIICAAGIACQQCDFVSALKVMQSQRADIIGVPKIPDVKWDDIGGLEDVKETIRDTIQLPLEHPELVAAGLRRSGILLYGPPGTGKTLLAKAVATQCSLSFLSVKGPELINMYVGQSEENVRKVFSRARDAAPCVVFFDELDSLAPNRGKSGDSGGVMDRVVSQLLAELDGLVEGESEKQIFVIGASNRPDLIDPALLRPGRFDKLLYVGINADKHDQLKILEAQTRRANLSVDVRLEEIIDECPTNMTGADFYALTSAAMMNAIRRQVKILELEANDDFSNNVQKTFVVKQNDFIDAAKAISPSVSNSEISRYLQIKSSIVSK